MARVITHKLVSSFVGRGGLVTSGRVWVEVITGQQFVEIEMEYVP